MTLLLLYINIITNLYNIPSHRTTMDFVTSNVKTKDL